MEKTNEQAREPFAEPETGQQAGSAGGTYWTIRSAYDRAETLAESCGTCGNVNLSSVLTRIIQETGRFAEGYASDVLYEIDRIKALCGSPRGSAQGTETIVAMGIRRNGVDHDHFIMLQLHDTRKLQGWGHAWVYPEYVYRRILAAGIRATADGGITCTLKDITDGIHQLDGRDLDPDGNIRQQELEKITVQEEKGDGNAV